MPAQKTPSEERWGGIWRKPPLSSRRLTGEEIARIQAAASPEVELVRLIQSCPRLLTD
jgi:hypothetical protein